VDILQNIEAAFASLDQTQIMMGVVFVAVVLIVVGASGLFTGRDTVARRLAQGGVRRQDASMSALTSTGAEPQRRFQQFDKYWTPQDEKEFSRAREKLVRAGYRRPSAVRNYYAVRVVMGLIVPITLGLVFPLLSRNIETSTFLLLMSILIVFGFYAPALWVEREAQYREEAVRDGFPDTLDMLLVCVEAGLGLDAALDRVSQEIRLSHPVIADELDLCGWELRAGKARLDVLRDFARRVNVLDVKAFVAVLTQSDRYGTSVAEAIRVYSSEMRNKRLMRAEEKANKLPVKLALGAILFTLPPVLLVMISPALVSVLRFLKFLAE